MAKEKSRPPPPPRQNLSKYLLFCFIVVVIAASDTNRQPRQHLLLPTLLPPLLFRGPTGLFGRSSNTATYLRGPSPVPSMPLLLPFHPPRTITTFPGLQWELTISFLVLQWIHYRVPHHVVPLVLLTCKQKLRFSNMLFILFDVFDVNKIMSLCIKFTFESFTVSDTQFTTIFYFGTTKNHSQPQLM